MNKRNWTIEEDDYIKDSFGKISFTEMSKKLNCAISTIQSRCSDLGLEYEKRSVRRWTVEEIELLKLMAPKYLNKTLSKKLDRSIKEVNKKAKSLGIELIFKRPIWKNWKVKFLRENLNKMSLAQISREIDINYYQIMDKIIELNLEYKSTNWTKEETEILVQLAPKYYIRNVAIFLNRTEAAVISKARRMGLEYITLERKYTEEELNYIKENWGKITVVNMARKLGVSNTMVQSQADKMGLPKLGNNPYRKWTDEKIAELKKLAKEKTITELAKYFKTTNGAIETIASTKSIKLIDEKVHWTEEDNKMLKEYSKTMNLLEIAHEMDRSTSAIRLQANRLGIDIISNESIWTEENTIQLKKLVKEEKTLLEITKIMGKKDSTIQKKANELKLEIRLDESKPWTEEEIEKLILLSKTKKLSELVIELNRTSSSIKQKANKLKIKIIPDRKRWTKEEYEKLDYMVNVEKRSVKDIASILDRTEDAINIKMNRRGLIDLTNDKRAWTEAEEIILSDLWGSIPIEKIAKKLNRTVSSLRNRAFQLELGSQSESNYEGLKIKVICDLFNVRVEIVSIYWVALGLKLKVRNITKSTSYEYVEIKDLYEFLEKNQNIWDSRSLEKNILGEEPDWLKEKRKSDKNAPLGTFGIDKLTKQQLIVAKKMISDINQGIISDELEKQKIKKKI